MKKLLLIAVAALATVSASAQLLNKGLKPEMNVKTFATLAPTKPSKEFAPVSNGKKKSIATNLWYQPEEGIPSVGWNTQGGGWYDAFIAMPPFEEVKLINRSLDRQGAKWFVEDDDITEDADTAGNMIIGLDAGYYFPNITVKNSLGTDSWSWGDANIFGSQGSAAFRTFQELMPLTWADPHVNKTYFGYGYLNSGYIFGTGYGQDDETGGVYQSFAYAQRFSKPKSPMYVENIHVQCLCYETETPIPAGETVIMSIIGTESQKELVQLTCSAEDIVWVTDQQGKIEVEQDEEFGEMRNFFANFAKWEVDPLSGELASVPFVLDEDFEVYIYFSENSNFGFYGHANAGQLETVGPGVNLVCNVANPDDMKTWYCNFGTNGYASAPICFNALFDKALVSETASVSETETITDFNVVIMSNDGKTAQNAGYPSFPGTQAYTALPWFDEFYNENYTLDVHEACEYPEWILSVNADDSYWYSETDFAPISVVSFEVDALPATVAGRGCKLYINGRGCKSEKAIYVLQGNYTKAQVDADEAAAAITGVKADHKVMSSSRYNIAGQIVGSDFKGIMIKDGKKIVK